MNTKYYCVGFNWKDDEPKDQLPRFKREHIWENGYSNKFQHTVNNIPVGSRLAAKTTYTRKDANGKMISVLDIHAMGTVKENPQNGKILSVDWDKDFKPFKLDGKGAYRSTISTVHNPETIKLIFDNKSASPDPSTPIPINEEDKMYDHPLNKILYGPPGTGKTFNTINRAISIIENYKPDRLINYYPERQNLKDSFDELLIDDWENPSGQIAFVTFHQSMSYEDFVEGIKPLPPKTENGQVIYKVEDGIFKRIAKLASQEHKRIISIDEQSIELTEELFEELYNTFAETLNPANAETSNCTLSTSEGYKFDLFRNSAGSITIKAGKQRTKMSASFNELRKIFFEGKEPVYRSYEPKIIEKILEGRNYQEAESENIKKPFILIIDEINRGNISQIFGELITLIEPDKRQGNEEALEVILPYSKERFAVPPNLYIIGTMNTADRSVEALDTALRRRFEFEEMSPTPDLLTPERMLWAFWWKSEQYDWTNDDYLKEETPFYQLLGFPAEKNNKTDKDVYWKPMRDVNTPKEDQIAPLLPLTLQFTGINLSSFLKAINKRIEKLLGKDYMIGHAYLINVHSIAELKSAFFNKMIPLLQEYFYGDYGRIGLVIGDSFLEIPDVNDTNFMSVKNYELGDLPETRIYRLRSVAEFNDDNKFLAAIKKIYEPGE